MTQVTGIVSNGQQMVVPLNPISTHSVEEIKRQHENHAEQPEQQRTMTDAELDQMLKEMQQISTNLGNKLQFSVNKSLDEVVVKVVDPDTDKVIKEIPPVALQKMQIRIKEALGILFDDII